MDKLILNQYFYLLDFLIIAVLLKQNENEHANKYI
jgi:hypothetical protein